MEQKTKTLIADILYWIGVSACTVLAILFAIYNFIKVAIFVIVIVAGLAVFGFFSLIGKLIIFIIENKS